MNPVRRLHRIFLLVYLKIQVTFTDSLKLIVLTDKYSQKKLTQPVCN